VIVLDTNVISEALAPVPSEAVLRWMARLPPEAAFITTITQAEILYGIELMPTGKRRTSLAASVQRIFADEFADRILPFDEAAAQVFARVAAARRAAGRPISQPDAQIAAIARSRNASLATRDISDFELCGIELVNPWGDEVVGN
jgi:predicted nucleic acid-binding protein